MRIVRHIAAGRTNCWSENNSNHESESSSNEEENQEVFDVSEDEIPNLSDANEDSDNEPDFPLIKQEAVDIPTENEVNEEPLCSSLLYFCVENGYLPPICSLKISSEVFLHCLLDERRDKSSAKLSNEKTFTFPVGQ